MKDGFLLIDKPTGPTSHDVVRTVRYQLGVKRVGHAGSLDPFASGLLIVLVGNSTRLFDYLSDLEKTYEGTIRLGISTDTDDRTGAIVQTSEAWHATNDTAISSAMGAMVGRQLQIPPVYSAKKVQGEPSYRRVRRGEQVELKPTEIQVSLFECTGLVGRDVGFRVRASTGTYIRGLARDLGETLGCGAHLHELRRIGIGPFTVANTVEMESVSWADVQPPADLVTHLPSVTVDAIEREALRVGQPIAWKGPADPGAVAVLSDGALVAIATSRNDGLLRPRVVLDTVR